MAQNIQLQFTSDDPSLGGADSFARFMTEYYKTHMDIACDVVRRYDEEDLPRLCLSDNAYTAIAARAVLGCQ